MRSLRLVFALAAVAAFTGCAVKSTEYSASGLYLGASVIGAMPNFDDVSGADLDEDDVTEGLGLRAGYRFLDRFAVELGYEGYADFEMDVVDVEISNIIATAKFYPFTGSMQPYGLLGVGYQYSEIDDIDFDESDPAVRIGLGLEWYLIDLLPLFVEVDQRMPSGDSDDLEYNTLQLGAMIRF
jgi:hypothetical protein